MSIRKILRNAQHSIPMLATNSEIRRRTAAEFLEQHHRRTRLRTMIDSEREQRWVARRLRFERRLRLCDPEVATVNSSLELTVGSSSKGKPTVTRAVSVARRIACIAKVATYAPSMIYVGSK
jgi:hypothetical protein